ncbi:hypothetical protein TWF481_002805 [Arthrobotrys musiformis]|uniref:C2H2-type domain-containing protein n=1 Tax=Arthrobotrys musiformis TaxID=47236 RepID=A0AAV9VRG9_9PEZI
MPPPNNFSQLAKVIARSFKGSRLVNSSSPALSRDLIAASAGIQVQDHNPKVQGLYLLHLVLHLDRHIKRTRLSSLDFEIVARYAKMKDKALAWCLKEISATMGMEAQLDVPAISPIGENLDDLKRLARVIIDAMEANISLSEGAGIFLEGLCLLAGQNPALEPAQNPQTREKRKRIDGIVPRGTGPKSGDTTNESRGGVSATRDVGDVIYVQSKARTKSSKIITRSQARRRPSASVGAERPDLAETIDEDICPNGLKRPKIEEISEDDEPVAEETPDVDYEFDAEEATDGEYEAKEATDGEYEAKEELDDDEFDNEEATDDDAFKRRGPKTAARTLEKISNEYRFCFICEAFVSRNKNRSRRFMSLQLHFATKHPKDPRSALLAKNKCLLCEAKFMTPRSLSVHSTAQSQCIQNPDKADWEKYSLEEDEFTPSTFVCNIGSCRIRLEMARMNNSYREWIGKVDCHLARMHLKQTVLSCKACPGFYATSIEEMIEHREEHDTLG